jgi:glycosyltransferase involved in cell wall biosynthesis
MNAAKVSVILSTYCRNREEGDCPNLLKRAVDSILCQEFREFELIIIDDGSTDGTKEVLEQYAKRDKRIVLKRFEDNSGLPAKRYNEGMMLASAPYFTFMFDDDRWFPQALNHLYYGITHQYKTCGMIYGLVDFYDARENKIMTKNFGEAWDKTRIETHNFISNNSVIVKREVINLVGGYDERRTIRRLCDWELWLRISRKFAVARIPQLIGEVYTFYKDSMGETAEFDWNKIKGIADDIHRELPLKGKLI